MKEKDFKRIGEFAKEFFKSTTEETAIVVKVLDDAIEVWPSGKNEGHAVYCIGAAVDFSRVFNLSIYVTYYDSMEKNVVRMF